MEQGEVARGLISSCAGCPLSTNRSCGKFTEVDGGGKAGVLVVAEASGEQEAAAGLPLRPKAKAGSVFESVIRKMGLSRDNLWITNILRCRPPRNHLLGASYEREAIDHCRANLDEVVETLKPKAIVMLGAIALRELTGLVGEKLSLTHIRGYTLPTRYGIPGVATFHPSYLQRGTMHLANLIRLDMNRAVTVAQKGIEPCTDLTQHIQCRTGIEDLQEIYDHALADPELPIAIDCETEWSQEEDEEDVVQFSRDLESAGADEEDEGGDGLEEVGEYDDAVVVPNCSTTPATSELRTVQYAVEPTWGVSVPWTKGFKELAVRINSLPNPKIWHNGGLFDEPVMEAHEAPVAGIKDDTLDMCRTIQSSLPAHLMAAILPYIKDLAPWKHLAGVNLELYGVIDACVLIPLYHGLVRDMKRIKAPNGVTVWDGYVNWVRPMRALLNEMSRRGLPVDTGRLDELRSWLGGQLELIEKELQLQIPDELRRGSLKEGCKAVPEDVKEWLKANVPEIWAPFVKMYKNGKTKEVKPTVKIGEVYQWLMSDDPIWTERRTKLCLDLGYQVRRYEESNLLHDSPPIWTLRLVRLTDWNPGSPLQLLDYLRFRKYSIPLDFKTQKPTTASKEMDKLYRKTKDPVLKLSGERRVMGKLVSSYTGKLGEDGIARGGWVPGPDGRLRATVKVTSETWQLRAANPNILTLPKRRKELANKFRECIKAEPGHVMIEFDYQSFHALMTAREARDQVLARLSKLDVHSFVAGHLKKYPGIETCLSMSDEDLKQYLAEVKAAHPNVREFQAKPAVHGTNFGQGYRRLFYEYSEHFKDEAEAKRLLDLLRRLFPPLFKWQDAIVEKADRDGKLVSNWGAVRWFHDAVRWEWDTYRDCWKKGNGSQAEQAKAFLPANHAHGMMRMKLLEMMRWGWLHRYGLVNIPHDALWFHCLKELASECIEKVREWMKAPVIILRDEVMCPGGFVCGVDAHIGPSLGEMEKVQ